MKRLTALLVALAIGAAANADDFNELFTARLAADVTYRQAALQLRQAEQAFQALDGFYLPYLSLSLGQSQGISVTDGVLSPIVVRPTLSFANVFGAQIDASIPVSYDPSDPAVVSLPGASLSVSRRLFEESDVSSLSARAALLRARDALDAAYANVRVDLITDIYDAAIVARQLQDARSRYENAQRLQSVSNDPSAETTLERAALQARRALLDAQYTARDVDPAILQATETLVAQADDRVTEVTGPLPETRQPPPESRTIRAQELTLEAANRKRDRAFLPYIPNPTFSAGVEYSPSDGSVSWTLSVQASVTLLDRGEREVSALARSESAEIERLRLDDVRASLEKAVTSGWDALELSRIDLALSELDISTQRDELERTRRLAAAGLATPEAVTSAQLALSSLEIQARRTTNSYNLQRLRLVRYYEPWSDE